MSMDIHTEPGAIVRFEGVGGYPHQNEAAHAALIVGHNYLVTDVAVGNWETSVSLSGVAGRFNSVLFENVDD